MPALIQSWLYRPRSPGPLTSLLTRGYTRAERLLRTSRSEVNPAIPVIGVGSIVIGGAAKTPVARFIARRVLALHPEERVALISRAFRSTLTDPVLVTPRSDPRHVGDEARMLAEQLSDETISVIATRDRARGIAFAASLGATLAILDSGFHRSEIPRVLDIALAPPDLHRLALLPLGPLREPPSALERAHLRWLHDPRGRALKPSPAYEIGSRYVLTGEASRLSDLEPRPLVELSAPLLVTGIARNEAPRALLLGLGVEPREHIELLDHALPSRRVLRRIARSSAPVLTTPKDAVRWAHALPDDVHKRVYVLTPQLELLWGAATLRQALERAL